MVPSLLRRFKIDEDSDRRVLIAESDPALLDLLYHTLTTLLPDLSVDLCSSYDQAVSKLNSDQYHIVISSLDLATKYGMFLLKHHKSVQPFTPFLVRIESSEKSMARRVLQRGAFEVLVNPINSRQIVATVRAALWLYQLRRYLHQQTARIEQLRTHLLTVKPTPRRARDSQDAITLKETYLACDQSYDLIEDVSAALKLL